MGTYAGGTPYGEIYRLPTSAVDNIANRLYNEHKQEQADRKRSADLLDQEFGKNMSKMKDVDIPEFISKYNKFKQARIGLLKKGNKATPYDSLEVQRALSDAQTHLAGSIQDKNDEEEAAKLVYKNPNGFKLEAPAFLAARRNTPRGQYVKKGIDPATGKERMVDMSDVMGNIIDDGAGTDFTRLNKAALGTTPTVRGASTLEETPLTKTTTTYKAYNPPSQYIDIVNNGVKSTREKSHYVLQNQKTDEEAAQIIDAYSKLRQMPEFKNAYPNEPEIPATMLLTPFGKTVALKAMEDAITNPPIAVKGKAEQKLDAVTAGKQQFSKEQQARGFRHAERMAALRFGYSKALKDYTSGVDAAADETVLNKFINNTYDAGNTSVKAVTVDGKTYVGKVVDIPKSIKDQYIVDKGYASEAIPDAWYMTDDKKRIIPLFYGDKNDKTGKVGLKVNPNSKPIDIQNFKVDLGKLLLTQKQRGGEVVDQFEVETPATTNTVPAAPKTVKAQGYSRADLKAGGWTDDQINKAVKAGKIKLN